MSKIDIVYGENNDTFAVYVAEEGRLAQLVKKTSAGNGRAWIFKDPKTWFDATGDERFDHGTAGLVCGTFMDGQSFLSMCRELGLNVKEDDQIRVPLSRGKTVEATSDEGERLLDYAKDELRRVRKDLPTRTELMNLLNLGHDEVGEVNRPSAELAAVAMDPSQAPAVTFAPGTDEVHHVLGQSDHDR